MTLKLLHFYWRTSVLLPSGGKGELTHSPTSLPFGRLGVFIRSLRVN